MSLIFFLVAGFGLFLGHCLRLPSRTRVASASLAFVAGLLITALAIRGVASVSDIKRTTEFDRIVNAAVKQAQQDEAPLLIFTGASYSRNAINPEALTRSLQAAGYPHRVISLSLEAASVIERDRHLQTFIKQSGRVPDLVFVEVARSFDMRAAFIFGNSKFSARAIEQFDPLSSLHVITGLSQGACDGPAGCIRDMGFLGAHMVMNSLNLGLIGRGQPASDSGEAMAWDPQFTPRSEADRQGLSERVERVFFVPDWVESYRRKMRERLMALGVRHVAYYQPPVISAEDRAYVAQLCATELAGLVCLAPTDAQLLEALDADVWLDADHLLNSGAEIYSDWLIRHVLSSDLMESGA